ncbi:hypothetical protein D9M68_980340 [compost metagenome]
MATAGRFSISELERGQNSHLAPKRLPIMVIDISAQKMIGTDRGTTPRPVISERKATSTQSTTARVVACIIVHSARSGR